MLFICFNKIKSTYHFSFSALLKLSKSNTCVNRKFARKQVFFVPTPGRDLKMEQKKRHCVCLNVQKDVKPTSLDCVNISGKNLEISTLLWPTTVSPGRNRQFWAYLGKALVLGTKKGA